MIVRDPMIDETLCDLMRTMRQEADLTQYALADELDVPQSVVSKLEAGDRRADVAELRAICHACQTDLITFAARFEAELRRAAVGLSDAGGDPVRSGSE